MNRAERRRLEKEAKKTAKQRDGSISPEAIQRSQLVFNEALALQNNGKISQAIRRYKDALKINSNLAAANNNLGNIYEEQGKWLEAETVYRRALAVYPDNAMLLSNLGNVLRRLDKLDLASEMLHKALAIEPNSIQALINLGSVCLAQKQTAQAIDCFRRALDVNPAYLETYINLSAALEEAGEFAEAQTVLEQALSLNGASPLIYYNLGHVLNNLDRHDEAIAMYEKAIALKPDYLQACFNLATLLRKKERNEEAGAIYQRLIAANPKLIDAYLELAALYGATGDFNESVKVLRLAAGIEPKNAIIHNKLANALNRAGNPSAAIASFQKALSLKPDYALGYIGLGVVYSDLYQYDKAIETYRKALAIEPGNGAAYVNLAGTLHDQGKLDEAIEVYREALQQQELTEISPNSLYSNYLLVLNYSAKISQAEIYQAHLEYAKRFENGISDAVKSYSNDCSTPRKIRLGYVSTDFREHSVVYFIEPLIANHDHDQFEVYCYSDVTKPDDFTRRLQESVYGWRDIAGKTDAEVTERIRTDGIDILVDLNGHTGAGPRMLVFARKPAPLQISYLGYPNTTGLTSMDYRLTDAWADAPDQDQYHSEKLLRLDKGFLCYRLPPELPEVSALPAATTGQVTFGSFNNLAKMVPEVIALWSQILLQLSGARLILKNKSFRDQTVREEFIRKFGHHGVAADRLEFIGWLENKEDHLMLYNRIDLCLDTFPYNGTTTTCEAVSMGVPVITFAGHRHAACVGKSLLQQLGLTDFIADNEAAYLRLALHWAHELDALQALRAGMRQRLRLSSLADEPDFARRVELAYQTIWSNWCDKNSK